MRSLACAARFVDTRSRPGHGTAVRHAATIQVGPAGLEHHQRPGRILRERLIERQRDLRTRCLPPGHQVRLDQLSRDTMSRTLCLAARGGSEQLPARLVFHAGQPGTCG